MKYWKKHLYIYQAHGKNIGLGKVNRNDLGTGRIKYEEGSKYSLITISNSACYWVDWGWSHCAQEQAEPKPTFFQGAYWCELFDQLQQVINMFLHGQIFWTCILCDWDSHFCSESGCYTLGYENMPNLAVYHSAGLIFITIFLRSRNTFRGWARENKWGAIIL